MAAATMMFRFMLMTSLLRLCTYARRKQGPVHANRVHASRERDVHHMMRVLCITNALETPPARVGPLSGPRDAQHFVECRDAVSYRAQPVVTQRPHPFRDRHRAKLFRSASTLHLEA